ncbi:D-amino-acid transaminase, chloroplastic isoform X2 [Euphorbia lathyris]|uniref:D-amino-acid transaminase, chloroplastic isoform X2 n=1 Tax=Euphorbia lathyris TaxID=212925 RepID=UPI0033137EC2
MASSSAFSPFPNPQAPHLPSKIPHHLCNSSLFSRYLSFPKLGFRYLQTDSTIVRNSDQAEALLDSNTRDFDVPLLTCSQAIERLRSNKEKKRGKQQYLAMYSSLFGGITTDPAAMVIPMDDHMVHRGHGVFDTAAIMNGESIRRILIQTASVSKCQKGSLRYWLSTGPGDFQLSPSGCRQPALYAIVIQDQSSSLDSKGVKVVTSSIPIKPPQFATMKSVNYLPNVLSKMEAEENGAFAAIWLDNDGFIAEGPNMNVAFVTQEKDLLMPYFDKILSGCTAKRVLTLAEGLAREGKLRKVEVRNVTVEEGKKADEMMLIGSGILVRPVVQWDDHMIGDGKEGSVTMSLLNLILEDMKSGPPTVRIPVPGFN